MKKLILVRHGESEWNKLNLFTGWTNVDLSEKGIQEALEAGKALKEGGYKPEICFTSYLKRAIKTLNNILDVMDMDWLPVYKTWRLRNRCSDGAVASTFSHLRWQWTTRKALVRMCATPN